MKDIIMEHISSLDEEMKAVLAESEAFEHAEYHLDMLKEIGMSQSYAVGLNFNDELYQAIPDLPAIAALPIIGNPMDDNTKIACEAMSDTISDFWKWLKEAVARIAKAITELVSRIGSVLADLPVVIDKQATQLKSMELSKEAIAAKKGSFIDYKTHQSAMACLPGLSAELLLIGRQLSLSNYKAIKAKVLKATAGATAAVGSLAASGVATYAGAMSRGFRGPSAGSTMLLTAGAGAAVLTAIFTASALKNFVKLQALITNNGIVDMSGFNDHPIFKPKEMSLTASGWTQKAAADGKPIITALATMKQVEVAVKAFIADLQAAEKEAADSVKGVSDAAAVSAVRHDIRTTIQANSNAQKLATGMLAAATKVARNFVNVQKAFISCAA